MVICVSDIDGLSVCQADAETEQAGIYVGKIRDVIRILASCLLFHLIIDFLGNFLICEIDIFFSIIYIIIWNKE